MRIRGYFAKPKGVREEKNLTNTVLNSLKFDFLLTEKISRPLQDGKISYEYRNNLRLLREPYKTHQHTDWSVSCDLADGI